MQLINKEYGGTVHKKEIREDGQINIDVELSCPLFKYVCFYVTLKILYKHFGETKKELYYSSLSLF